MERSQRSRERDRVEQVEDGEIEEFSDKFCNRPHDSAVPRRSASSYSQRKNWDRDRDSRDHKPVDGYGKHTRVEKLQALTNRLAFRFVDNEYTLPTPSSSDGPGGKSFQISLNGPNKPVDSGRFDAQEPSSKNQQVGAGTFGVVFQSKCMLGPMAESKLGRKVAVKKIPLRHFGLEGLTLSTLREITLLEGMNHPNVISLVDVIADKYCAARYARAEKSHVYLVFPFMDHDLAGLIRSEIVPPFSSQQIKYYMKCITEGLSYLHNTRKIIHRDLKTANILISNSGDVCIADLGMARFFDPRQYAGALTDTVVTLWYRSPELLLGENRYSYAVDMWSLGCIFGELLCGKAVFDSGIEMQQLEKIFKICGTPSESSWSGYSSLRNVRIAPLSDNHPRIVKEHFGQFTSDDQALDLLDRMLTMDPNKRITAKQALEHPYFKSDIMLKSNHPIYPSCYEFFHRPKPKRKPQPQAPHISHQHHGSTNRMDEESKHRMRWTNRGADNRSPNRSGDFSHKRVRYEDDGSPQQHRGGYRGFSGHRRPQIPTKGSHDGETNFPNGLRSNRAASQSSRYHRRYE